MSIFKTCGCARPGRPKTSSDDDQRSAIIPVALGIFLAKGYEKMTMDDVAHTAGVSKKTVYRLFESKRSLFIAMIERHRTAMVALPGDYDHLSLEDALATIFRLDIAEADDVERMAVMRLMKVEAANNGDVLALLKELAGDRSHAMLGEWLEHQCALGRLAFEDTANASRILLDMIFGAIFKKGGQLCEWPEKASRDAYMRQCISIFVNGCRPR